MKRLGRFLLWFVGLFGALAVIVVGFTLGVHLVGEVAMTIGSAVVACAIVAWGASLLE